MAEQNLDATKQTAIADRELLPTLDPAGFTKLSIAFKKKLDLIEQAANEPQVVRTLRPIKTADILELTGLSERQVRAWRKQHKAELTHFGEDATMHPLTLAEVHRMMQDFGVRPSRPEGRRAIRLGVYSYKGGVGKSTVALHLATYLALHGYRVLAIDGDAQGSLSSLLGHDPTNVDEDLTLAPVFRAVRDQSSLDGVTLTPQPTHIDGLEIVPACLGMIGADMAIANAFVNRTPVSGRFYDCVGRAISTVEDRYDFILIDGAPAFSFAALALAWAVDGMVIPMPPEANDIKATGSFFEMIGESLESLCVRDGVPNREWAPVVVVHNRVKTTQAAKLISKISKGLLDEFRLDEVIPDNAAVLNALARFRSIYEVTGSEVDSRSLRKGRDSYTAVAQAIIDLAQRAWRKNPNLLQSPPLPLQATA